MEPSVILFTGPFLFFFTSFPYTHILNSSDILKINYALYGNSWQFSPLHFQHNMYRGKNCLCLYQTLNSLNCYINFSHFTGWGFEKTTLNYFYIKLSIHFKIDGIYILKYYHLALKFFSVLDPLSCISFSYLTVEMHTWTLQED